MKKEFRIPLLMALPALLAGCERSADLNQYQRRGYNSYAECIAAYQAQIQLGMQNPCVANNTYVVGGGGFAYWGPYMYVNSGRTRYIGYDSGGQPSATAYTYDPKTNRYSTSSSSIRRGGFTRSGRSGGFGG